MNNMAKTTIGNQKRLYSFDNFRAISILLIVASHSYYTWTIDTAIEKALVNLISGATLFFVFISGFFFDHIFLRGFSYKKFVTDRAKTLLTPYVVLTLAFIFLKSLGSGEVIDPYTGESENTHNLNIYISLLVSGSTFNAYWYIPTIFALFLLSPIFVLFSKLKNYQMLLISSILVFVAMFVQRSSNGITYNINIPHNLLYISGFFCLGIYYSKNKNNINKLISRSSLIITLALLATLIAMNYTGQVGNLHKENILKFQSIDLMPLLKIFSILAILAIMNSLLKVRIPLLENIAKMSFAIFFIHNWSGMLINKTKLSSFSTGTILDFVIFFTLTMLITSIIIYCTKYFAGRYSKYLIGY